MQKGFRDSPQIHSDGELVSDQAPPKKAEAARPAWWATSAVPYRWFWLLPSAGVPIGLAGASVFRVPVWLSFICAELPALALEAWWRRKLGRYTTHRG
jgi:hypothetical protein